MEAPDQTVEAPDQRPGNGDDEGIFERIRSSPRLVIAIAVAVLLICAWIAWAIYVTNSKGASAGLGVVIAWPAILAALAVISLPFVGVYLLIRRLSPSEGGPPATAEAEVADEEAEAGAVEDDSGGDQSDPEASDESSADELDDDAEPDPETKAATS